MGFNSGFKGLIFFVDITIPASEKSQETFKCSLCHNAEVPDLAACKTIPLQVWTGPEGSRRLRLPDFKTIGTRK